jgi:hypothetical protein
MLPTQFGPRLGLAWDPTGKGKTAVRAFTGTYYARTPMLLLAAPLNNFRETPGDLSVQLPFRVPVGNPNNTVYQAAEADRDRSQQLQRSTSCLF